MPMTMKLEMRRRPKKPATPTAPGDDIRAAIFDAQTVTVEAAERGERIRERARIRHDHAEGKLREKLSALKRLTTQIDKWESRAAYYARRMSVTNSEVQREMTERAAKKGQAS